MLRRIRILLATLFFLSVTALFVDSTGTVQEWLGWTAKIQFLPALLALNVVTVVALVVLTLLVGSITRCAGYIILNVIVIDIQHKQASFLTFLNRNIIIKK